MVHVVLTVALVVAVVAAVRSQSCSEGGELLLLLAAKNPQLRWDCSACDVCSCNGTSWEHVTCENGQVTKLELGSLELEGSLPEEWSTGFTQLTVLDLQNNDITGTLPAEWGQGFPNLTTMKLDYNKLSGELPEQAWKNRFPKLTELDLGYNCLVGNQPSPFVWTVGAAQAQLRCNDFQGVRSQRANCDSFDARCVSSDDSGSSANFVDDSGSSTGIIVGITVGITVGALVVLSLILVAIYTRRRRQRQANLSLADFLASLPAQSGSSGNLLSPLVGKIDAKSDCSNGSPGGASVSGKASNSNASPKEIRSVPVLSTDSYDLQAGGQHQKPGDAASKTLSNRQGENRVPLDSDYTSVTAGQQVNRVPLDSDYTSATATHPANRVPLESDYTNIPAAYQGNRVPLDSDCTRTTAGQQVNRVPLDSDYTSATAAYHDNKVPLDSDYANINPMYNRTTVPLDSDYANINPMYNRTTVPLESDYTNINPMYNKTTVPLDSDYTNINPMYNRTTVPLDSDYTNINPMYNRTTVPLDSDYSSPPPPAPTPLTNTANSQVLPHPTQLSSQVVFDSNADHPSVAALGPILARLPSSASCVPLDSDYTNVAAGHVSTLSSTLDTTNTLPPLRNGNSAADAPAQHTQLPSASNQASRWAAAGDVVIHVDSAKPVTGDTPPLSSDYYAVDLAASPMDKSIVVVDSDYGVQEANREVPTGKGNDKEDMCSADRTTNEVEDRTWVIDACEVLMCKNAAGKVICLGRGGTSQVYKATYAGKAVAVKMIEVAANDHRQVLREINMLRQCDHVNLLNFHGTVFGGGRIMLVFDFMPKGDLFSALHAHNTTRRDGGNGGSEYRWAHRGHGIALGIAKALEYLHSKHIVHCDIKSSNILLDDNNVPHVGDLGMSKFIVAEFVEFVGKVSNVGGTFAYAAPELLSESRISTKADVYSFGIVLWELVTGEVPQRQARRIPRVPDECSQQVSDIIASCLHTDPRQRPTAAQLCKMLASC